MEYLYLIYRSENEGAEHPDLLKEFGDFAEDVKRSRVRFLMTEATMAQRLVRVKRKICRRTTCRMRRARTCCGAPAGCSMRPPRRIVRPLH